MQEDESDPHWYGPLGRAGRGAVRWLRGSLQRWFVAPVAVLALVCALGGGALGTRLLLAWAADSRARVLNSFGQMAIGVIEARTQEMAALFSLSGYAEALTEPSSAEIGYAEAVRDVRADTIQAAAITDVFGREVEGRILMLPSARPPGSDVSIASDNAVQRAIQRLMTPGREGGAVELGLTEDYTDPLLFSVMRLYEREQVRGALVLGMQLRRVLYNLRPSHDGFLVVYDLGGVPIYSTRDAGGNALGAVPPLFQVETLRRVESLPLQSFELRRTPYHYTVHHLTVRGAHLGYLGVWEAVASSGSAGWQWILWAVVLTTMAAALGLGSWLASRAVRPVTEMVRAAQTVASGEFVPVTTQGAIGELAQLAETLNRMAGQVQGQTQALREQAQEASYLFQASAELGRSLDLDESARTAAEAIYGIGGLSYVVVMLGRGELGPYTCRAVWGLPNDVAMQMIGRHYAAPLWGVMARALVSRQPLTIDDVVAQNRPRPGEFDWDVGASMLLFPISGADEVSGLILVGAEQPGHFSAGRSGDMVFTLARIASHSILNAQLYQSARRFQEHLVTLQMISCVVASARDAEALWDVVLREAMELLDGEPAWLFLQDASNSRGRLHSRPAPAAVAQWNSVHQEAIAWVLRAGQPLFYDPEHPLAPSPILIHTGPAICVPLEVDEETIGVLIVVSRARQRPFMEDDMIVLRTLANSAAVALRAVQDRQTHDASSSLQPIHHSRTGSEL